MWTDRLTAYRHHPDPHAGELRKETDASEQGTFSLLPDLTDDEIKAQIQFIGSRPEVEPGFRLDRTEANDRHINYAMRAYAADDAHGTRYQGNGRGPEPDRDPGRSHRRGH